MLTLATIVACVPMDPEYYRPEAEPEPLPLTYTADGLERWEVEDACAVWAPEGVSCAAGEDDADLRIVADDGCRHVEDGELLGWHAADGEPGSITVFLGCLDRDDELVAVLAHEVGHALGIWFHVWPTCDTVAERDGGGPPICGPAVMNATGTDVLRETVPDHQAFVSRNAWLGVEAARLGPATDASPPPPAPSHDERRRGRRRELVEREPQVGHR